MMLREMACALLVSLVLTDFFTVRLLGEKPGLRTGVFLISTWLAAWAGGLWVYPAGPRTFGVYWLPFLLSGLLFGIPFAKAVFAYRVPVTTREPAVKTAHASRPAAPAPWTVIPAGILAGAILNWYG